jgi:hypothetical protein
MPVELEEEGATGTEGIEGQNNQVDETKYIPIERFNEVYKSFKDNERAMSDYKKYGSPDEIRQRHEKLTQWEKAVEEAKKHANETPDEKSAAERAARVRKELLNIFPELGNLGKIADLESKYEGLSAGEAQAAAKQVLAEHSASFTPVLKAAGIDAKHQTDIETYVVANMSEDQKVAFLQGDFSVAKAIFDANIKAGGIISTLVKRAAPIPPALRNPVGGTTVKGGKPKPMTMREAEEMGWQRLKDGE